VTESDHSPAAGFGEEARRRQVDQLCRFAGTLGATLDVGTLIEDSLEPLLAMAEASGTLIALAGDEPRLLEPVVEQGLSLSRRERGLSAPTVASLGTEARAFDRARNLPAALASRLGAAADCQLAVVPLWVHARLLGVVFLARGERQFDTTTLKLLTASGRQLALAIENSLLLGDLQRSYGRLMDDQEELIRSERLAAMGQLSATMAHEIRNPLATIFSAVSQIRRHADLDPVSRQLLDITEEEALRLNRMVTGLLEFARPRKPSFEVGRPRAVVAEAIRSFVEGGTVPEGVDLSEDENSEDPVAVFDTDLLQRAVSLLIANGLQAVEADGGRVRVGVAGAPGGTAGFTVTVSDNGCGIPRENLHRVFEPFYSTRPSGIGLSLPTAKRIAEDHGGSIEIGTGPGTGTTVRVFIPQRTASEAVEEKQK
jgi:signal transduction histidine kinase